MTIPNGSTPPRAVANGEHVRSYLGCRNADRALSRLGGFRRGSSFFKDYGVWKEAPVLTGTTKFEPLPDVKNIMITGGAGFMYDP